MPLYVHLGGTLPSFSFLLQWTLKTWCNIITVYKIIGHLDDDSHPTHKPITFTCSKMIIMFWETSVLSAVYVIVGVCGVVDPQRHLVSLLPQRTNPAFHIQAFQHVLTSLMFRWFPYNLGAVLVTTVYVIIAVTQVLCHEVSSQGAVQLDFGQNCKSHEGAM